MSLITNIWAGLGGLGIPEVVDETEQSNKFRWATVTSTEPLIIRFDGDSVDLPISPASLVRVSNIAIGARVWCQLVGRRVVILGTSYLAENPPYWDWTGLSTANFNPSNSDNLNLPKFRIRYNTLQLVAKLEPKTATIATSIGVSGTEANNLMSTLPADVYARLPWPGNNFIRGQGSSSNSFGLYINRSDGVMHICRYTGTASTGSFLSILGAIPIDDPPVQVIEE